MNWNNLQTFLAVAREGSLGAAARRSGQSQPTLGRHITALEEALGHTLFQRTTQGFVLTAEGESLLAHAEKMEEEATAALRQLQGGENDLHGMLRVSCSDWFGSHWLSPVIARFTAAHPQVMIELLTDPRLYSLPHREADCVIRMLPFTEPDVVSRRLLTTEYSLYAASGSLFQNVSDNGQHTRLILMDRAFSHMPDVQWITSLLPEASIAARTNSRLTQARLCALGVGLAVLPTPLGDATPGIVRCAMPSPAPSRDSWLGYHRDMRRQPRLRRFVEEVVAALAVNG